MLSLIFVALATFTNVQTGTTVQAQAIVPSITAYAELTNEAREGQYQDENGVQYVITEAHVVVLQQNEAGNIVYPE